MDPETLVSREEASLKIDLSADGSEPVTQLDRIEAELNRQGVVLEALVAARETELQDRAAAAAKRAKQQDLDTPRVSEVLRRNLALGGQ